ncbi:MAG: GxxExxY protein [Candidatus Neomarinimicrobiota bacterium]
MAKEFSINHIPFQKEVELPVFYRGEKLNTHYRADFVCFDNLIVELKALKTLTGNEES